MGKTILVGAAMALLAMPGLAADSGDSGLILASSGQTRGYTGPIPPDGYASQWWTHPLGCEYSRAGRPGEIVWYMLINTRRKGCPSYIVQRGFPDIYN